MYMNGSGIESYYYTVDSTKTLNLPTGVISLINMTKSGTRAPLNGEVYCLIYQANSNSICFMQTTVTFTYLNTVMIYYRRS